MKQNKFAYLFAAALAAGTVGMTSCSSEANDLAGEGVENKVTLSLSVADRVAGRATADEVNLGTSMQTIKNIHVVPMIDEAYLNPIKMGDLSEFSSNKGTIKKNAFLNTKVNKFKVYGNIENVDNKNESTVPFDENRFFSGFTITLPEVESQDKPHADENAKFYKPHGLYYYGYAGVSGNQIKTGEAEGSLTDLAVGNAIGSTKFIKLGGVNYAVGVLATAVFNGDANNACIYDNQQASGNGAVINASESGKNVSITGIIINGQKQTLNEDFVQPKEKGTQTLVSIFEKAAKADFPSEALSFTNKANGNFYVLVTETGTTAAVGEGVTGNIEFTLEANKYLKTNSGAVIGGASKTKFYLPFALKPSENKAVFMKDYITLFNAKVKNWGLASDKPVEITDANIAVEVDTEWQEGIVYDLDI